MIWLEDELGKPDCPFPFCRGYGVPTGERERHGAELTVWFDCDRCALHFYGVQDVASS